MTHADDLDHCNGSHQRCDVRFDEAGFVTLRRRFLEGLHPSPARHTAWDG
ncbi:hypothetical protein [Pseudarthrobacter sp. fls2-241-R2A-127]|nr:hypothetical protein [Pseudarthrobacter sp. fls2-241-R2A-127]